MAGCRRFRGVVLRLLRGGVAVWHHDVGTLPFARVTAIQCKQRPSIRPPLPIFSSACSFPGLEKKAKARPAGTLYRLLTVADPVLDPVRRWRALMCLFGLRPTCMPPFQPTYLNRAS